MLLQVVLFQLQVNSGYFHLFVKYFLYILMYLSYIYFSILSVEISYQI
jgi:hypothetical protein